MSCAHEGSLIVFLSSIYPFYFLFLPFVVAVTSSNMLNLNGEVGLFCLVPNLRWKAFSLLLLSMLAIDVL